MLSSAKAFWVVAGLYLATILLPAWIAASAPDVVSLHQSFPPDVIARTLVACVLFILGMALGTLAMPIPAYAPSDNPDASETSGIAILVAITAAIAAYVAVLGPPAPFFQSFSLTDPNAILFAREDAVKLNPDRVFVRLYSWGRDIFSPVAFALCARLLMRGDRSRRPLAWAGLFLASYLGLWSGQKATLINYLLATFIFTARSAGSMIRTAAIVAPALLALVAVLFRLTLPQLAGNPDAVRILAISISNRLLFAPFEVATAYIDAVDRLRVIAPGDAVPYLTFLWTPSLQSLENEIGIQYFTANQESSIHANGAAFAYAYVLGGHIGAFVGGLLVALGLRLAMKIAAATGSPFLLSAFAASTCYMLLDLHSGNLASYLPKIVVLSLLLWGMNAVRPGSVRRAAPAPS